MVSKDYLIILGAPKCGTTSLADFVGSLPNAVLSDPKETSYFTGFSEKKLTGSGGNLIKDYPRTVDVFLNTFGANPDARLRIEASTDNLWWPAAPQKIYEFSKKADVGKLKLLMITRDPVQRIVSEYEHTLRLGWQKGSLLSSLQAEERRMTGNWHPLFFHITRTRYAEQLMRYRALFDNSDILILDFHRLGEEQTLRDLCTFLGYDNLPIATELDRKNKRYVPSNHTMHKLLQNATLLKIMRALVPQSQRAVLRKLATPKASGRYVPNQEEIDFIRNALAEDVEACFKDADIPTDRWNWA